MFATVARLSKASRRPLTPKRGNKDFYKGTRQAYLPGGHRTGAPGVHVIGGKAKYRILDEKVRVYVAPPIEDIINSPLKPYVSRSVHLTKEEEQVVFGKFPGPRGLTAQYFLDVARGYTVGEQVKQGNMEKMDALDLVTERLNYQEKAARIPATGSILEESPAKA